MAKIIAVCTSPEKGMRKKDQGKATLIANYGLEGDAHASGEGHRQVSLLAMESIKKMQALGLKVHEGDFAENLTTEGIELFTLPIGTRMAIGEQALVELSQIGKECHKHCAIYEMAGDCVMPREGIFVRVLVGGEIKNGDEIKIVNPLTAAVLTVSDKGSRGQREDLSGPAIKEVFATIGGQVVDYEIIPDEQAQIEEKLKLWADRHQPDFIFTTGGTGFSLRDVTPEATKAVIEREAPGFAEVMRAKSLEKTPHAMLSRACSGLRGKTIIINLPGSPKAVKENLQVILPALKHGSEILRNLAGECAAPQTYSK